MNKGKMCGVHKLAALLLVIGGLNWGLVAISPDYNLVDMLGPTLSRVVYALVGISAIAVIGAAKCCMKGGCCGCGACADGACEVHSKESK